MVESTIFFSVRDAIEHFLRVGFELTEDKRLVKDSVEVVIKPIGSGIYKSYTYKRGVDEY